MLSFQANGVNVSSPPPETVQVAGPGINTAMATEFGQMSTRLFSSPYFKSVDALVHTGHAARRNTAARAAAAAGVHGRVRHRRVRGAQRSGPRVRGHSAEVYTASATAGIALLSLVLVALFLPFTVSPLYTIGALLLMLFMLSRAIANYHLIR
jgi:hypothetical protein